MRKRGMTDNAAANGAGPFLIEVGALDAGERFNADLRNRTFNGRKGYFRRFLPFDTVQVTNTSTVPIRVTYNGQYRQSLPANTTEAFSDASVSNVRVENVGQSAIAAEQVSIELVRDAYDADDAARADRRQGVVSQLSEKFVGVTPSDLLGGGR